MTELVNKLADRNEVRSDVDPSVLARWLFHSIHAPPELDNEAVGQLLVDSLAHAGMRPLVVVTVVKAGTSR